MQKTTMMKREQAVSNRKWYIINATEVVLGDLAVKVANLLRGKEKPTFTPNIDCGDFVIVTNTDKVILTGNKKDKEFWYTHSQYIGGLRARSGREMINKYSDELVWEAVKGMVPHNRLGRQIMKKLFVYKDGGVDHSAQQPIEVKI